jgi:hypothetical protein
MMSVPFVAFGNGELTEPAPWTVHCQECGEFHVVHDSVGITTHPDGSKHETKGTLQFYKCGDTTYLAGVMGKSVMK